MKKSGTGASFRLEGVSVRLGTEWALHEVDLEIESGETVGCVGPSGAGKTTLLRLLSGSLGPTRGRVWIDGRDLGRLSEADLRQMRGRIGIVHQDLRLVPNLRVLRNVLVGRIGRTSLLGSARRLFLPTRREVEEVLVLLERVGIGEKLFERTDHLSGGQRQRVAIARALYQAPRALLPDEPISSLDPARARDTMGLLLSLAREEGFTLVASLHDLEAARGFLPRLVGLRRGRVAFDGPTEQLTDDDFRDLYRLQSKELLTDGP